MATEGHQNGGKSHFAAWLAFAGVVLTVIGGVVVALINRSGGANEDPITQATTTSANPQTTEAPSSTAPTLSIDVPREGDVVSRPTTVTGRIIGRALEQGEEVWAGRRGPSYYYMDDMPCLVQRDEAFRCTDVRLGTGVNQGPYNLCILLVNDPRQFENRGSPGIDLDRRPVLAETCVAVST